MISHLIYLIQIGVLAACIYMTWRARKALNGLARGLILLLLLLIARRIDDAFRVFTEEQILILSSAVVAVIAIDIYAVYRERAIYAEYLRRRKERIAELEAMRQKSEEHKRWDDEAVKRIP